MHTGRPLRKPGCNLLLPLHSYSQTTDWGHGCSVLYLLMFIQTCNVMWQRNKARNMSTVCATHKLLKLRSNSTRKHQHYLSVQLHVTAFTCTLLPEMCPHYACYKHSTPRNAIPPNVISCHCRQPVSPRHDASVADRRTASDKEGSCE